MMIGNGQWVTTRDEKSVELFLADIQMRRSLSEKRAEARSEFWWHLWDRLCQSFSGSVRPRGKAS
jgi:hypothetical protein